MVPMTKEYKENSPSSKSVMPVDTHPAIQNIQKSGRTKKKKSPPKKRASKQQRKQKPEDTGPIL
eukprot:10522190-Ditylum_brightwellii.AAC.1